MKEGTRKLKVRNKKRKSNTRKTPKAQKRNKAKVKNEK